MWIFGRTFVMFKKYILSTLSILMFATISQARITSLGESARVGIAPDPQAWDEVNLHAWDVFTSLDANEILGLDKPRETVISAEFYSTGVMEGRKVGDFTAVASLTDRGSFFGGDGYMDFYYYAPVDTNKYAQQIVWFGGWKYNLTKYLHIDIGGNFVYSTKRTVGPGIYIDGMGGETFRGDIYVAFSTDKLYVDPFVLFAYDPTFDCTKFNIGINPKIDLYELTAIRGLSIEAQAIAGYVRAQRFSGSELSTGGYWRNSYAYIQTEANLVYKYKQTRTFIGVGWAIHNDGEYAPNGVYMGNDNNVWVGGGIGWMF